MNKPIKPTESELEILGILWERGRKYGKGNT